MCNYFMKQAEAGNAGRSIEEIKIAHSVKLPNRRRVHYFNRKNSIPTSLIVAGKTNKEKPDRYNSC